MAASFLFAKKHDVYLFKWQIGLWFVYYVAALISISIDLSKDALLPSVI